MLSGLIALLLSAQAAEAPAEAAQPPPAATQAKVAGGGSFESRTMVVEGPALQVVFGERALFHLDDNGEPVLDGVERGSLAIAHPTGAVKEAFAAPKPGQLAVALDGSPAKKASYLKIWNGLDQPTAYRAGILAYGADGLLHPQTVRVCAAPAKGVTYQTWPVPVAAVVVANFKPAPDDKACN